MTGTENKGNPKKCTIRLTGLQPGTREHELAEALSRIDPRQSQEQFLQLLNKLPVVLTRSATEETARKIHALLAPKGAILKVTYTPPAEAQTEEAVEPVPPKQQTPPSASLDGGAEQKEPSGIERRVKPRVHPGIQIHPMGVGEILDRSFRLLKEHFWMFFLILFFPQFAYFAVNLVGRPFLGGLAEGAPSAGMGVGFGISAVVAFLIFLVLQFWAQGALIHAVSETYLGHQTSVRDAYGSVRKRLGRLLGTLIVAGVLVFLWPALALIVPALVVPQLAAMGMDGIWMGVVGGIVFILLLWMAVRLFLNWLIVDKVVVLEDLAWMRALRRSKELMNARMEKGYLKRPKNKAALIIVVGFVIAIGIHLLFQLPAFALNALLPGLFSHTLSNLLEIIATSLATAYTVTAMILFYYDIRLRKEGFDLKMMAQGLG